MPFAAALRKSLQDRHDEFPAEFKRGDSLEHVLNRHLMTVEKMGGDDFFTCILLLSSDGKRLFYGAAPTVPTSYCRASDSIEIGPCAGSCGAAAYFGRPIYSIDIATDPVWGEYRDLALQHGFRSCWSTPIRNANGAIVGTFAILHRTVGRPTRQEIEAIDLITGHVADAIMWARDPRYSAKPISHRSAPVLRLVADNQCQGDPADRLLALAEKLQTMSRELDSRADGSRSATALRDAAELSRKLATNLLSQIDLVKAGKVS